MKYYIFDIDGTLALNEHRQHFIAGENKDWDAFFEACDKDEPNLAVLATLKLLLSYDTKILFFSGRSESIRAKTVNWLNKYINSKYAVIYPNKPQVEIDTCLWMRPLNDYAPDEELKQQWFNALPSHIKTNVIAVFDDRQKVVDMWRAIGVPCFQVAEGDF